jgi:DNA-directed RNA polymerase specialized sigma subunit
MSAEDTTLDAIAAQVRALRPLSLDEVQSLLREVRRDGDGAARERLVEHHLGIALQAALQRSNRGLDIVDLYQEGTVATIIAISEYAARSDAAAGLAPFVSRLVAVHLEHAIEDAEIERRQEEAFVRDAQLYEAAELALRDKLGREANAEEVASVLEWPEERVAIVAGQLLRAREMYDSDIVQYLDDDDEEADTS